MPTVSSLWPDTILARQRTLVQIDGAYLSALGSAIGFALDFRNLRRSVDQATRLLRAVYYVDLLDGDDNRRRLTDWLDYNGFTVSIRKVRPDGTLAGHFVAMAVDAISHVQHYDHLVLIAGHDALLPMVRAVRDSGPRVTLIASLQAGSAEVSDRLRRAADHFVDAAELQHLALQAKSVVTPHPSASRVAST